MILYRGYRDCIVAETYNMEQKYLTVFIILF